MMLDVPRCVGIVPDAFSCLLNGEAISNWFMQRMLNPGNLCDYESKSCESLFD